MTTTISAISSETSSADGGRFTTTYTAFRAREPREAEAGVITLLLARGPPSAPSCPPTPRVSGGSIGVAPWDREGLERFRPIPITGVGEPFQRLESLPCSRLLQTESTPVSAGLERFELRLPAVKMISDSRDLF